jgi:hypothetical protein
MPHNQESVLQARLGPLVFAAAAYGILVYLILPSGIVALDDDFAYLRSVVLTLQQGRPWTDDWLEPWSAGSSALAAIIYRATGSFYFSTYGLLSLLAAVTFLTTSRLLVSRGLNGQRAIALAFLGLTFPTVLWKTIEFTGMAVYVPCLLLALFLAERRRWGWFLLTWAVALSTRQSALTWAALPAAAAIEDLCRSGRKHRPDRWLMAGLVPVLGLGFYLWLNRVMNKTHAQRMIADQMWTGWNLAQAWRSILIAGVVLLLAAGLGSAVLRVGRDAAPEGNKRRRATGIAVAVALAVFLFYNARDFIACDHPVFDTTLGGFYLKAITALAAGGWLFGMVSFRPVALAGAIAAMAALTARGSLWDYYLIDVAVFGFFAVKLPGESDQKISIRSLGVPVRLVTVGVLALQLMFIVQFKARLDRGYALCTLGSRALSEGRIPADEASFLPFGLMAWYFYPYYIQHEGADSADLGDFGRYLKQDTVDIAWRFSKLLRRFPDHDGGLPSDRHAAIIGGRFRYCWFFSADVLLLHASPERTRPARSAYPDHYDLPAFPTEATGWDALIRKTQPQSAYQLPPPDLSPGGNCFFAVARRLDN